MNRNDDLLNQVLKTEQAGCRKDDTQCCGKCVKPTYEQLAAQLKQSKIDAECYKRGMDASNKLIADVVAENAALKDAIQSHSESVHFCELCGKDDPCSTDDVCYVSKKPPPRIASWPSSSQSVFRKRRPVACSATGLINHSSALRLLFVMVTTSPPSCATR